MNDVNRKLDHYHLLLEAKNKNCTFNFKYIPSYHRQYINERLNENIRVLQNLVDKDNLKFNKQLFYFKLQISLNLR